MESLSFPTARQICHRKSHRRPSSQSGDPLLSLREGMTRITTFRRWWRPKAAFPSLVFPRKAESGRIRARASAHGKRARALSRPTDDAGLTRKRRPVHSRIEAVEDVALQPADFFRSSVIRSAEKVELRIDAQSQLRPHLVRKEPLNHSPSCMHPSHCCQ